VTQLIEASVSNPSDKLPPHSIDAESCLLASMLLDKELIGQVIPLVDREAFYQGDL
jgi:replicative DNA helicase